MSLSNAENQSLIRCSRCVLDTSASDIWFDDHGDCKYCKIHDELDRLHPLGDTMRLYLEAKVAQIKKAGEGKRYDCIVGVSGGRDSTYTLLVAKQLGLRPLAVHFDNGWNTDISVKNIRKACEKLQVELYTVVADWEEFRAMQRAFLKSSTPDADIPTDYAIYSVLYHTANREGIRYILNGHSFRTEGTSPISWTYMDPLYVKDVLKKNGKSSKIRSFPHMGFFNLQYYLWVKRIREFRILEYIDYNQKEVDRVLTKELDWEYYGGHHHENHYTKFFQSYYLPAKFGIDKRKTELSALVRSGQLTREQAIEEIEEKAYAYEKETIDYALHKLGFSENEWNQIMHAKPQSHNNFRTLLPLIRLLKLPIKVAVRLKVLPEILYLKYAK